MITLLCVDTSNHILAARALVTCMKKFKFAEVVWMTNIDPKLDNIRYHKIPEIRSIDHYNWIILKELRIKTSHVLLVQWDGYIVYPEAWSDTFLEYDYIGAVWGHREGNRVGNGGFSLRSRKLLNACRDSALEINGNEDETIANSKLLKKKYGIKIAGLDTARKFSFETELKGIKTFGFHGVFNFPLIMSQKNLISLLPYMDFSTEAFKAMVENCKTLERFEVTRAIALSVLNKQPGNAAALELLKCG